MKTALNGIGAQGRDFQVHLETVHLSPEGVRTTCISMRPWEWVRSSVRSLAIMIIPAQVPIWEYRRRHPLDGLLEVIQVHQVAEGGALAAGHDQRFDVLQVSW